MRFLSEVRRSRSFAVAIAAGAVLGPSLAYAECPTAEHRLAEIVNVAKTSDTLVLAHRGYWGKHAGLPSMPENSMGSVAAGNESCMDGLELDVKMTKDKVPILMHDWRLGRTTTVFVGSNQPKFDPQKNIGYNPAVSSFTAHEIDQLKLLTPARDSDSGFAVPRVEYVINEWRRLNMRTPLVFDAKTVDAVKALDEIMFRRLPGSINVMAVKVNATLYPDPGSFFGTIHHLNVIPVYTTNMLGKISVHDSLDKWMRSTGTIEINVKQPHGLLSFQLDQAKGHGNRVALFHALPDGPNPGEFYRASGACCYKLSEIFYHHRVMGQPAGSDTEDHRGEPNFIVDQGFGLITTDDPRGMVRYLTSRGKRRSHFQDY